MEKVIGFATEFYTLWNYRADVQYITDAYGNHHQSGVNHVFQYCKNISKDIEKVKTTYPDVRIDTSLRGTRSFTKSEKLELPEGYFWGGKYAGRCIDEIIDIDLPYCIWSAKNYNTRYILNHPKYIAHLESIEQQTRSAIESANTVKVGDVIELQFVSNGYNADDNYTECWAKATYGDLEISVLCNSVKPVFGKYPYLMPIINGVAKKTKNRTIMVHVLEIISTSINNGLVKQSIRIQ